VKAARRLAAVLLAAAVVAACTSDQSVAPVPSGSLRQATEVGGAFEFVVIGDFGTGEDAEWEVAGAIRRWSGTHPVEALVTTGDNIYESGDPEDFTEAWRQPYGWVRPAGIRVVASLGNHDVETEAGVPVMKLFSMPGPWYAHRFGPVEFFVLDGNRPEDPAQLAFLAGALRRSRAPWRIAVFHQPALSCGNHEGSEAIRERWVPVLRAGGVDLILSGHDHNYQRFPVFQDIVFLISGGGGQDLHEVEDCPDDTPPPVATLDHLHHFLYVRATSETARIRAVAVPGSDVVDDVRLRP
jgi:hypothetical protein